MKILVIEDEVELRETLKASLAKEDYMVETASDFYTALDKVLVYDYDCILLDVMLPGGSGLQVLEQLKKEGKSDNVIIISAKDSLDDKLNGLELGADDYLTKPFHIALYIAFWNSWPGLGWVKLQISLRWIPRYRSLRICSWLWPH